MSRPRKSTSSPWTRGGCRRSARSAVACGPTADWRSGSRVENGGGDREGGGEGRDAEADERTQPPRRPPLRLASRHSLLQRVGRREQAAQPDQHHHRARRSRAPSPRYRGCRRRARPGSRRRPRPARPAARDSRRARARPEPPGEGGEAQQAAEVEGETRGARVLRRDPELARGPDPQRLERVQGLAQVAEAGVAALGPEGLKASKPAKLDEADELRERERAPGSRRPAISTRAAPSARRARSRSPSRRSRSLPGDDQRPGDRRHGQPGEPGEAVVVDRARGDHPAGDREPGLSLQPAAPAVGERGGERRGARRARPGAARAARARSRPGPAPSIGSLNAPWAR